MVDLAQIRAHVDFGLGKAAAVFGNATTQYRPVDPLDPLGSTALVGTLQAAFDEDPAFGFERPARYGQVIFHVLADASTLAVGDYLSGPDGVFFIITLENVKAASAVRTNAVVSLVRPIGRLLAGENPPGGDSLAVEVTLLRGWPAALTEAGRSDRGDVNLPGDVHMGNWDILLPQSSTVQIRASDILVDQSFTRHIVMSAEATSLGWRIIAVEETT